MCLLSWEGKKVWHWNFVHWQSIKYRTFLWQNHAENVHQKLVTDPFLILVKNPKQPMHARNSFENKIFCKRIIKNPQKVYFLFQTQSLLIYKIIEKKRGLELVTSCSSDYEIFRKIPLLFIYYLTKFVDVI